MDPESRGRVMRAATFIAAIAAILVATFPDLAHAQDTDGDTIPDIADPCPRFANTLPINGGGSCDAVPPDKPDPNADCNNDGIPNECQCGDTNGDGKLLSNDAAAILGCGNDPFCVVAPPDADLSPHDINKTYGGLWDTNYDQRLLSNDAAAILQLPNLGQAYRARCGRRPGDPNAPPGLTGVPPPD